MSDLSQFLCRTSFRDTVTFILDGAQVDLDSSALPAVTITRPDGTTVTPGTIDRTAVGTYRVLIPAQVDPTLLTIAWTGNVSGISQTLLTYAEVIGGFLFTLPAAKAWDGGAIPAAGVSDADILAKRVELGDDFQRICGVSFFPRYAREVLDGDNSGQLLVRHHAPEGGRLRLLSVSVGGVAQNLAGYTLHPDGTLEATAAYLPAGYFPRGRQNVVVEYVHGWGQVPAPVSTAALIVARVQLVPSNLGDRATSISTDQGVISLATAGRGAFQPYGIPAVDSRLARFDETVPAVG